MEFAISQQKKVRLPWNEKQTYWLKSRPQMWPSGLTLAMTLTLNVQGQIWNFPYLSHKWSDCHETKSKHIDLTQGLKCGLDIWPHTWSWPWIAVISERDGRLTLNKGGGSWSFVTMSVTIWWPRLGVRFCQIVTGVTSRLRVCVSSTHLVYTKDGNHEVADIFKSFNSWSSWLSLFGTTFQSLFGTSFNKKTRGAFNFDAMHQ